MTPQQIEALKLALGALEIEEAQTHYPSQFLLRAITAIKEALAEHAMQEVQRLGLEIEPKIGCVNHDCDQCKAPPEQEPVAKYSDIVSDGGLDPRNKFDTTPPQRTWVGLTEQDLDYLCNLAYTGDEEFALAVQAKLMEKNT